MATSIKNACWERNSDNSVTPPSTLLSEVPLRTIRGRQKEACETSELPNLPDKAAGGEERTEDEEEDIYPNGTHRDSDNDYLMKKTMARNIKSLDHLIAEVYRYSEKPMQCAQASAGAKCRSLNCLTEEFHRKMGELESAIKCHFYIEPSKPNVLTEPPKSFSQMVLYILIRDLRDNWIHFMRVLEISEAEMERCRNKSPDVREQKYQMLLLWFTKYQHRPPKYHRETIISALEAIEQRQLAAMLKHGNCLSVPVFSDD